MYKVGLSNIMAALAPFNTTRASHLCRALDQQNKEIDMSLSSGRTALCTWKFSITLWYTSLFHVAV